jgi:fructosamine-3-kinase
MASMGNLIQAVEAAMDVKINDITPVSGGCISNSLILTLADNSKLFCKWNSDAPIGFFAAEAEGLKELAKCEAIRVPRVYCVSERNENSPSFIVMEVINQSVRHSSQDILGRQLC